MSQNAKRQKAKMPKRQNAKTPKRQNTQNAKTPKRQNAKTPWAFVVFSYTPSNMNIIQ